MDTDVQTSKASRLRELGNKLYKTGALKEAIKAYKDAAALDPSDPLPLSNLSAAYFEAGSYSESAEVAQELLGGAGFADDRQAPQVQKLLIRSAKSLLHLAQVEEAKEIIEKISPGQDHDGLSFALTDFKHLGSSQKERTAMDERVLRLPRMRPIIQPQMEFLSPSHDEPESHFTGELENSSSRDSALAFMYCGIGDARHLFRTVADFFRRSDKLVHFTVLDMKPTVMARLLICLSLLKDAGPDNSSSEHDSPALLTLSYLYCAQIIPPYAQAKFEQIAQKIEAHLDRQENPFGWVSIPKSQMGVMSTIIRRWRQDVKTAFRTSEVRRLTKVEMAEMSMGQPHPGPFVNEHKFLHDFWVLVPSSETLSAYEPELASLVAAYQSGTGAGQKRPIEQYLDSKWSMNPTFVDFDWDLNMQPTPEGSLGADPFGVINDIVDRGADMTAQPAATRPASALQSLADNFREAASAINKSDGKLMIEILIGDMLDLLERIRYGRLDRHYPDWPREYHSIHMSNIPDYAGGSLTSFLYAGPLLKSGSGTGLKSNVMRNPPQWKSVDQFNAEYLLMHNPNSIEKHFSVKLSAASSATDSSSHTTMLYSEYPLLEYKRWERTTPPPIRQQEEEKLALNERLSRGNLFKWLYSNFLKLCLPYPRDPRGRALVFVPLNMTAWMRLVALVAERGYPSHWISQMVSALASGTIMTTARAPRQYVLTPAAVDQTYESRAICVRPWADEFATLVTMWRKAWPCELLLTKKLLPSPSEIAEYSIRFPVFGGPDLDKPHFMLLFWNQAKFSSWEPPNNLRRILLDDETGDSTSSARSIRADGVKIVSTFSWDWKSYTARFWLGGDVVGEMCDRGWSVYLWRVDTWQQQTRGTPLAKVLNRLGTWDI